MVDMPRPEVGPHQVLAKVRYTGVCATDVSIMKGTLTLGEGMEPIYPVRLGHEWSGTVVEVGSDTSRIKVGDNIISDTQYFCGECEYCLRGENNNCVHSRALGTIGECWPGAFAEYMLVMERCAFKVPENVPLDQAAMIEPSAIGLYGLTRAPLGPGNNLLVLGTGPIGMGGMACAKGMGMGKTILAGRKDAKLAIGKKLGADILVNTTKENLRDVVMRETGGRGMDVILDTTGDPTIFNDVLMLLRPSGYLVIPGFYEQDLKDVKLDSLIVRNCTLVGAAGTPNMGPKILDLLANRHIDLSPMITDRFPFSRVEEAFAAVTARNDSRVKVMVEFEK